MSKWKKKLGGRNAPHFQECRGIFLGGLSLHLNHLIAWQLRISYRQFGTLPFGILLSNLVSRQLMTCPRTPFGPFWHMSIFGNSRAVWVLLSKYRPFRKSIFSRWRSDGPLKCCGLLGGQMAGLYGGTIFRGGLTHSGGVARVLMQMVYFSTHLRQLRGYSALADFIKNQSIGVPEGTLHTLVWIFG